ncbi:hypothetical protein ACQPYA_23425 [Micromonospora sp. CA-263727]|uniref:hypothetical protein n=1 Tax=Micromonospora sp. CA-263727 TaxID=3239967 RepID=UPI003D90CAB8
MGATDPGSAREEAERLVATLLATARMAAAGPAFATGAAECCVCPVCRGIAALRDPSPEFSERLATGAGDLAAGLASFLRAFASAEPAADPAEGAGHGSEGDHVWREATRTGHDSQPAPERDVWSAATRAAEVAVPTAEPVDAAGPEAPAGRTPADRRVVPASRVPDEEPAPDTEAVPGGPQGAPGDGA